MVELWFLSGNGGLEMSEANWIQVYCLKMGYDPPIGSPA